MVSEAHGGCGETTRLTRKEEERGRRKKKRGEKRGEKSGVDRMINRQNERRREGGKIAISAGKSSRREIETGERESRDPPSPVGRLEGSTLRCQQGSSCEASYHVPVERWRIVDDKKDVLWKGGG
eukprot:746912-Hanusia_phi.AAC.3